VTDVTGRKIPADELRLAASHALAATLARLVARHPKSTSDIVEGDPASEIIASAERHKADLIVMGTNGREGLPRLFLGSVTERVVRASPVPVLTISPHVPALAPVVAHEDADGARPASLPLPPLA
jgi:nucleotide-binding universal stress UspA family protein